MQTRLWYWRTIGTSAMRCVVCAYLKGISPTTHRIASRGNNISTHCRGKTPFRPSHHPISPGFRWCALSSQGGSVAAHQRKDTFQEKCFWCAPLRPAPTCYGTELFANCNAMRPVCSVHLPLRHLAHYESHRVPAIKCASREMVLMRSTPPTFTYVLLNRAIRILQCDAPRLSSALTSKASCALRIASRPTAKTFQRISSIAAEIPSALCAPVFC